jgi:hypothetical protein
MLFRPSDIYHEHVTYYMCYDRYIWIVPGLLDKDFFLGKTVQNITTQSHYVLFR